MKHASLITLGCKVNSFDTAILRQALEDKGYTVSDKVVPADIYIINSCTVTNSASSQSRQVIRKARKLNPDSMVIVTGCYAQVSPDEVAAIDSVDYVFGNKEKERIVELIGGAAKGLKLDNEETSYLNKEFDRSAAGLVMVGDISDVKNIDSKPVKNFNKKSRAFLKVQDGCESYCTYCIIPAARGRSRSLPIEDVENQALEFYANGYNEIVLTGIHLGGYGLDLKEEANLLILLKRLEAMDIDMRFRISSIEPTEIDDEMIEFLASSGKICRHLHIPLQSGDEYILSRMGRKYKPSFYMNLLEKIARKWDGVALGIDIIAGFPGESKGAFLNSYKLIDASPASYLHVFPYSVRNGTPAAAMPEHVDPGEIKERCSSLRELGNRKKTGFYSGFLNRTLNVIAVGERNEFIKLLSDNYIDIYLDKKYTNGGKRFDVTVAQVDKNVCYGVVADEKRFLEAGK